MEHNEVATDGTSDDPAGEVPELALVIEAAGTFSPNGPPSEPPLRVEAGGSCIVDLKQAYTITGTLSGSLSIDYRILVAGPCGLPLGTFNENWIAHGTFTGTIGGAEVTARFSYAAQVKAGGEVDGLIVFGPGLQGELQVSGNFSDGRLAYEGRLYR
jgi:hypothetical protein